MSGRWAVLFYVLGLLFGAWVGVGTFGLLGANRCAERCHSVDATFGLDGCTCPEGCE